MTQNIELEVNQGLWDLEHALEQMFTEKANRLQAVRKLVASIDKHGCDGYLSSSDALKSKSKRVSVLAVDVAWFVPGIDWVRSKGGQVCWSRKSKAEGKSWYRVGLDNYFSDPNAVSLLSIREVYRRKVFINLAWLESSQNSCGGKSTALPRNSEAWDNTFEPSRSSNPATETWGMHFQRYCMVIAEQLKTFHPDTDLDSTMVAWVYVGPGQPETDRCDSPPHWGASIFLIFQSHPRNNITPDGKRKVVDHVNTLLANLLRSLQNSAPAALGNRREKQTLVQVVAHEFKNISQEASIQAQDIKSRTAGLMQSPQAGDEHLRVEQRELKLLARRAAIMNYSVQLCSAFALAANWLFSPKGPDVAVVGDPQAIHFRHALALTLRLVATAMPGWTLENVPSEQQVLEHFRNHGVKMADRLENLTCNLSFSVMVFFALEAVRNMRAHAPQECEVQVGLEGSGSIVCLTLVTPGDTPAEPNVSYSLTALVLEVRLHCPWPLIEIDPIVRYEAVGLGRVKRTTKFTVHNILPL